MEYENVWIVVPAYNEEQTIARVIDALKSEGWRKIVVVNDGSRDRTAEIARSKGALVIEHKRNMGLGAALRTGLDKARGMGAGCVVTFDADGQHDPKAVRKLVDALDGADLVIGIRHHLGIPLHKRVGNFLLNLITWFFGGMLIDSQSGFRALGERALDTIRIRSDRYEVSSEIIIRAKKLGLRLRKVPVKCFYTKYSKTRGTTIASGFRIALTLLKQKAIEWGQHR
jgi:glycosyltransferase involved in cell wall biosynthesis